jgi:hypothetical protein
MSDPQPPFSEVLAAAIADLSATGYVSPERVAEWVTKLRNAAERELGPDYEVDQKVREGFTRLFQSFVGGQKFDQRVPGVGRFTKEMVKPKLYAELDRRIMAAADLIKVNKKEAVDRTLRRFAGWATSIPPGGDETVDRRETRAMLGKELRDYRYHRRLVDNDQGHKLVSNVANIVAMDAAAIAAAWHSHGATDLRYDARKVHLAREGKIYLIRDSWAVREGLLRAVHGYTDEIEMVGQLVGCRCWYQYIFSPRRLPDEYLMRKGQEWVAKGRDAMRRMMA